MVGNDRANKHLSWTTPDGKSLTARQLAVDELDLVYALAAKQLRTTIAPIELAQRILAHNADSIWGVYRREGERDTLAGFLSFLMLTADGANRLREGTFDARHPALEDLVHTGETPALVYVWLVVAPGLGGLAIPLTTHVMGQRYIGLPLCSVAATEAGAQALRNFGFQPVHKDRPDLGNLFWRDGARSSLEPPAPANALERKIIVAHSSLEFDHARAIRAAVFMAEQQCPFDEEFDGNDHTATHMVGYVGGEPAATLRIRYFGTFVKIERLAVLKRFRGQAIADDLVRACLEFCRRKGYRKAYGHPQLRLLPFWEQYGFRKIEQVGAFTFSDHAYVAVEGDLEPRNDAIVIDSNPYVIVRPEGAWDEVGILDRSASRAPTNPHAEGS